MSRTRLRKREEEREKNSMERGRKRDDRWRERGKVCLLRRPYQANIMGQAQLRQSNLDDLLVSKRPGDNAFSLPQ
eukprot:845851-Amorphochlora_amoeboformis.AAC.1